VTPERWRQITDVFDRAVALAPPERDAFVRGACTTDSALRAEVESMLAAHESAGTFGERPVGTLTITAPRLAPGTAIGCYCIETLIGAGGMGEVYRAHDTRLNRDVAIKVLPSSFTDDRERMTRFEREARLLAALNHPGIGAIHGLEESDNVRALVLELIEGETLSDRLHRGPLTPAQAVDIAIQIAEALDHAHRRGVTHRDLKPSNIMLTAAGVKIFDFGLGQWARPLIASAGRLVPTDGAGLTTRGTIFGTLHYMAPEQVEGKPVDARTDLFAFGVVFYEMLAGRKAFDADTPVGIAGAILHTQPSPLAIVQPATPPALEHIVSTCLAKDPDQRWQSAGDVARQLQWIRAAQGDAAVVGKSSGRGLEEVGEPRRSRRRWLLRPF
jgi:serine/threonine protein kinase